MENIIGSMIIKELEGSFSINELQVDVFLIIEELILKWTVFQNNVTDVLCFRVSYSDLIKFQGRDAGIKLF